MVKGFETFSIDQPFCVILCFSIDQPFCVILCFSIDQPFCVILCFSIEVPFFTVSLHFSIAQHFCFVIWGVSLFLLVLNDISVALINLFVSQFWTQETFSIVMLNFNNF